MKTLIKILLLFVVLLFNANVFAQLSFSGPTNFTLGTATTSLIHADINGDGKQDIIAIRQVNPKTVTVILNTTAIDAVSPSFSSATDFTVGGFNNSRIATADFNNDGKPDIVASESFSNTISVLLNTTPNAAATPTFSSYVSFATGNGNFDVTVGDINGDGKIDIISANWTDSSVSVLLNTTADDALTPSFSNKTDFAAGTKTSRIAIGDFNGDGKPDIVTANETDNGSASVLLNTTSNGASTPTFSSKIDFTVGTNPNSVVIADFNGDGKSDIVTSSYGENNVSVLLNTTIVGASIPSFSSKTDFTVGTGPAWVAIADFDGDGKSDVVTSNQSANTVSVLLNTTTVGASSPTFSGKSDFAVGTSPGSVTNADINGDNKPDIITSNTTASVLLNTTSFPSAIIWDGSTSTDWNVGDNWSTNVVPTATDNVTIPDVATNDPVISSTPAAVCKNLIISWGTLLTINAGQSLSVYGTMTNVAGTSGLVIQSNASGTGSLIHSQTAIPATIQRYLTGGWDSWDAGWHQLSSPVAVQRISKFETTGEGNAYDFYGWEESSNLWMNYKDVGFSGWNGGTNFNAGQGYLVSYQVANNTQTFTGELKTTNVIKSNLSISVGLYSGWHLMGNPYASALSWNDGNWALNNVAGNAKIWNETNKSYSDIAANGFIPSAQGFMVQVNNGTNSITIPAVSRVHNATPFYKSVNEQILLVAAETEGGSAQESKITINPMATEGFDFEYDSRFLGGYAPVFYSLAEDEYLSTNSLPTLDEGLLINFSFIKNNASAFTITLKESTAGRIVYLTDKKTGVLTNLSENPVYSFTSSDTDAANRFLVSFGAVRVDESAANGGICIYAYGDVIYIETPLNDAASVQVYNLAGQLVLQTKTSGNTLSTLSASALGTGVYMVQAVTAEKKISRKIAIRK